MVCELLLYLVYALLISVLILVLMEYGLRGSDKVSATTPYKS